VADDLVHFNPFWSTSVHLVNCGPIWSTVQFDQFGPFCPLRLIWSTSVHSVHFCYFGPFSFNSVHFNPFSAQLVQYGPRQSFLVHFGLFQLVWSVHFDAPNRKYKFGFRVSILNLNLLKNIN